MVRRDNKRIFNESTENTFMFNYLRDIEQATNKIYDNYFRKGVDFDDSERH